MATQWVHDPQYEHHDQVYNDKNEEHHVQQREKMQQQQGGPEQWRRQRRQQALRPVPGLHVRTRLVHRVVACLVRGGKVITPGLAMCSEGSPRLRPHVARLIRGQQPRSMTQHAEIAALNRLPEGISLRQLRQTTLIVIRPKYNQKLGCTRMLCAQPCRECAQIIFRLGLKAVIYSSDDALHRRTPAELLTESMPSSGTEWLLRKGV
mmetsp:Transcript_80941/g.188014  ORF Transcript_80941/g.188014 Transcript_80941/m.188014 type:complete len:207 (+) Transcript_80941:251-871(+)